MNVVMTGSGDFVEIQATAEGRPFTGGEMQDLLALAAAGIRRLGEEQRTCCPPNSWAADERRGKLAVQKLILASGNPGKLKEYQILAAGHATGIALLPGFAAVPEFPENAPTFAENAAGQGALLFEAFRRYGVCGRFRAGGSGAWWRSGSVFGALRGPGASSEQRNAKLLHELRGKKERSAPHISYA